MSEEGNITDGQPDGGQSSGQNDGQKQGGEPKPGGFEGNSLLTKPDSESKPDSNAKPDNAAKDGQDKDDSAVPDKPEGYDIKFAEGVQVDKELLTGFQKAAHELGISKGNAQKLAEMYEAHASKAGERFQAEQSKVMEAARTKWEAEIQASPNFDKERDYARSALRQYGDKELYDLLDQTNLGSHPKMWAFLASIGKELAEPGFKGESISGREKTAAEVLYPNHA